MKGGIGVAECMFLKKIVEETRGKTKTVSYCLKYDRPVSKVTESKIGCLSGGLFCHESKRYGDEIC